MLCFSISRKINKETETDSRAKDIDHSGKVSERVELLSVIGECGTLNPKGRPNVWPVNRLILFVNCP